MKTNHHREEMTRENLLGAFGDTPPAFKQHVNATLRQLVKSEEERIVKRKMRFAPALALMIVLLLAAIAVAAAILPNTAELFTQMYGNAFGDRLSRGDAAKPSERYTLGDVDYTVSDVIFAEGVLYGSVLMQPREGANVVLMPADEDLTLDDCIGSNPNYGEAAPEGTKTYREVMEAGASVLLVRTLPDGYVVGEQLLRGDVGYTSRSQADGSVIGTFELHGWNGGIERAERYALRMYASCAALDREGNQIEETRMTREWDVEIVPEIRAASTPVPEPEAVAADGMRIAAPDGFTGRLPEYGVHVLDFSSISPDALTSAEIADMREDKGGVTYTLADGHVLTLGSDGYLFFDAYDGMQNQVYETEDGQRIEERVPKQALSSSLYYLASEERFDADWGMSSYVQAASANDLESFSVAQAQAQMDDLFAALGIAHVQTAYIWGVNIQTAHALNERREARIEANELSTNMHYDVSGMTQQDEGYYVAYTGCVEGVPATSAFMNITAFVNAGGVRFLSINSAFTLDEAGESVTCMDAKTALAHAIQTAEASWIPELADRLRQAHAAELVYTVRDKATLVPAWQITAYDGETEAWPFTVLVSAEDGRVLSAPWQ